MFDRRVNVFGECFTRQTAGHSTHNSPDRSTGGSSNGTHNSPHRGAGCDTTRDTTNDSTRHGPHTRSYGMRPGCAAEHITIRVVLRLFDFL
ncbi:MAG: hypothetical protein M1588_02255 [Planctomycetes bacterium]|nr:hypothetical protein [Planctomycetota bacterium]